MKSFRIFFMLVGLGSLNGSLLAQDIANKSPIGVTLGQPSSEATPAPSEPIRFIRSFVPIRQVGSGVVPPSVVRGARPMLEDELRTPLVPRDLSPAREPKLPSVLHSFLPEPSVNVGVTVLSVKGINTQAVKEKPEAAKAPECLSKTQDGESTVRILSESESRTFFDVRSDPEFYARGEYLHWWARGFRIPPLVTTASAADPADTRGALGFGTTRVLFGDTTVLDGSRSGARFTLGWNCDPCGIYGIEASFFFLGRKSESANFDSSDFPVIGRPFFFLNIGQQSRELTTTPEFNTGNIRVDMSTRLFGAEVNKRLLLWCGCDYKLTGILGFRYLDLNDRLSIEENSFFINDVPAADPNAAPLFSRGDRSFVFDRFETNNRFYGGQIGLDYEMRRDRWVIEGRVKLGFGVTHQTIDIDGGQRITRANGNVQNFVGGLLALDSNIGNHSQNRFGFVPEVGLKVGYDLNDNVRVFAGYDFLYWSSVIRPGDQIDQTLDVNRVPNAGGPFPAVNEARPRVPFTTSSYWAHGFTGGLEFRY